MSSESPTTRRGAQLFHERPYGQTLEAKVRHLRIHEKMVWEDIADELGYSMPYVRNVWLESEGSGAYERDSYDDLCDNHQQILQLKARTNWYQKEIAEFVDVGEAVVSRVVNQNEHILEKLREDLD